MIRSYISGDESSINDLFESVFQKKRSLSEWHWKFETLSSLDPIILIAEEDNQIVGHAACLLFEGMDVDGSQILIGERVDIMVHPDYQGRGIYQSIVKELIKECELQNITYMYGFPAERAKHIFINMAQATNLGNINRYISFNLSSIIKKRPHQLMKTLSLTDLLKMSNDTIDDQIHIKRSKEFLTNRFVKHPSIDYFVYQLGLSYVIYRIDRFKMIIPVFTILDISAEDEVSILRSFKQAVGAGIISTWCIPNTPLEQALFKNSFKVQSSPMPFVVKTLRNHESGKTFDNWRILQGDVDSF